MQAADAEQGFDGVFVGGKRCRRAGPSDAAALDFADEVIILERGRIAWTGTPAALAADEHTVETLLGVGGLH